MPRPKKLNAHERIIRAGRANEVLENPAYQEAIALVESTIVDHIARSTTPESSERFCSLLKAARLFQEALARFMKDGEIDLLMRDQKIHAANGGEPRPGNA